MPVLLRLATLRIQSVVLRSLRKMSFQYPKARLDDTVKDNYHGVEVLDPFRWLEDPDAEETKAFVDAQNAITRPFIDSYPLKDQINKKMTELWNYPKFSPPYKHGNKYFQFRNTGLQNQSVIYVQETLNSEAKVFLDPNLLSEDGTIALSGVDFSENGAYFAYGLSKNGSDWLEIKCRDVNTGKDYDEVLKKVKFTSMSWTHDDLGFFYCAYLDKEGKSDGSETDSNEKQKLYYHRLGTEQSDDVVVVQFEDPQLRIGAQVSNCGKYLIVTSIKGSKNNLLYFARLDNIEKISGLLDLHPVVTEFEADYEYVANTKGKFVFRTNKDAPNYKLVLINFDNLDDKWEDLIPVHENDVLDWAKPVNNDQLVLCYLRDVKNVMSLHKLESGEKMYDFPLELGTISCLSEKHNSAEMFYGFCSFLKPNVIYQVDLNQEPISPEIFYETKLENFDPNKYESKQVFYESKDGTQIPMFIVNKKGLIKNGTNPCLLYGYGGFNITLTPSFSVTRLIFMDCFDGVFALPNIRGGGEYGDKWHNGGRFENKQNCFDDFQNAAKYLIENKYTSKEKLIIQGGSNGGLLVAACINQAPQLFGAAICQVGVLDMLRYHKFTIGYAWKTDYGCSDEPDQFKYLYKYSPLHNVQIPENEDVQYPATLLLTADHDDRVVPLHSLKFIAEIQRKIGDLPQQKNPIMIRVETRAGHGAGKPTSKIIDEVTDTLSFIAKSLQLKCQI
ncbi:prolyl endopeptidase-like isoform X1 [Onthophagus taurus]|uniref:prolyl endopeptidase-like isoform X1 n=1 Tax=Onthophagus taurus TaxID=166361 RepID=UPI0039BE6648